MPASIAARSVSDIGGSTLRNQPSRGPVRKRRRSAGTLRKAAIGAKITQPTAGKSPASHCQAASATTAAPVQTMRPAPVYQSASAAIDEQEGDFE